MEKLEITATMKGPVIIGGGYMTLDAILGAILFDQLGSPEEAHDAIPIERQAGLFKASAAMLEPTSNQNVAFVANLRAAHSLNPDLLKKNKAGGVHAKVGLTRRRSFGAVLNNYTSFDVPEITWYAKGDGGAISDLLSDLTFIGKRRGSGFGEVKSWSVEPGSLDGVVGHFGEPLRPVPEQMFDGDQSSLKVDAAWRPPYWHPENRAICFAPDLVR